MKCLFEGTGVAIVTPFKNGEVDLPALKRLIERDITDGAKAIIVLGTTGESSTITDEEREKILKISKETIAGRAKFIVGTGSNNFEKAKQNTLQAKQLGADGALVVTPYYNKTTQRGLVEYYTKLAEIGIPIIMYNVPSRTGLMICEETVKTLAKNPMIYGLKESTTDVLRIINLAKICKNKIALYSGEDALNYVFYTLGGNGCVSVTANVACKEVQKVYSLAKMERVKESFALHEKLMPINKALFCETNPIPVKYMLSKMGYIENEVRMPLVPISKKGRKQIDRLIEEERDC